MMDLLALYRIIWDLFGSERQMVFQNMMDIVLQIIIGTRRTQIVLVVEMFVV